MNKARKAEAVFSETLWRPTKRFTLVDSLTHNGCFGRMLLGQTKWDRGCCQASWRSLSRAERTGRLWGFRIPLMLRQGVLASRATEHLSELSDFFAVEMVCGVNRCTFLHELFWRGGRLKLAQV